MADGSFKRKLAAVFSADVVGYSRLMGEDETATVKTLEMYKGVMSELIRQHRGRVVDSPGDNMLAEFPSVVDAVQCAVAVQKELQARNVDLPDTRRMDFRIGINLGDVIEEEGRIYGDGVNIAARLEALASPGGICVSKTAFDQIETKLPLGYEYIGEQTVKNIARPVGAYRVMLEPRITIKAEAEANAKEAERHKAQGPRWRPAVLGALGAAVVAVIVVLMWPMTSPPPPPPPPQPPAAPLPPPVEKADPKKMAFPLPDKPSIAVLPFVNMSDDKEQEYFSDGMTEDLITDLSKISGLFVIARNSTFVFKGKSVEIAQVAEKLGVRYVLEGSVRRAGDQVRINTQLIDATTGGHLWSERYDGSMKDIFALQDKINQKIVAALAVKLTPEQKAAVSDKGTNNPAAYDEFLKGAEHFNRYTREEHAKAEVCFKRALELDPRYARARASLAGLYWERSNQWFLSPDPWTWNAWAEARLLARHHLREAMKEPTPIAYKLAGVVDVYMRRFDTAISHVEKALALDPNNPASHAGMSFVLNSAGRPAEGFEHAKTAVRLDPEHADNYFSVLGHAYFCMGKWEETVTVLEKWRALNPAARGLWSIGIAAYALVGRDEEARAAYEARRKAGISLSLAEQMYYQPLKDRRIAESLAEGLLKAGMPGQLSDYIHVSKEDQLTEQDLRALAGSTFFGLNPDGSQWTVQLNKDGDKGIYRGSPMFLAEGTPWRGEDTASVRYEGDSRWFRYEKLFWGMEFCQVVYKNPRGTPERKDEYVIFGDLGMRLWSPVR